MNNTNKTYEQLQAENAELRNNMASAQQTIDALKRENEYLRNGYKVDDYERAYIALCYVRNFLATLVSTYGVAPYSTVRRLHSQLLDVMYSIENPLDDDNDIFQVSA